ncbi:hypothetical protein TWF225_009867 [Orbilia oligospora]|uniref:Uncharacterized protein n=1 Tax=Orbilia oligospora TaxID=2813651 RepID=A0A7C8PHX0_ORBOL|nr:hypothetical protein TWF751_008766 [Orbilia oligospora]KAF3173087.1 hypothetical protein TWF225_009867 [Orbilia oligospora]KAF3266347.1 hypothetical protein TWF128_010762 [Orbilia oligospora]KAF3269286.1 hypothetical protein TWF217_009376 [Orbilia oligospora]KAF3291644.1 hypothetical protein TWF132_006632 [Orbilia oligospora]
MSQNLAYSPAVTSRSSLSVSQKYNIDSYYSLLLAHPYRPTLPLTSPSVLAPGSRSEPMTVTNPTDSPFLRLPYELHQKIGLELTSATDTIALTNTCSLLRQTLQSCNYLWYRLLYLSGSIQNEYDTYIPGREYLKRVVRIRQGKRFRCQNCLAKANIRTVDCYGAGKPGKYCYPKYEKNRTIQKRERERERAIVFMGVYCTECLGKRFYDIVSFELMQDKLWEGIINPPLIRLPKWLVCKALLGQYTKHTPSFKSNNPFSTDQTPIVCIPKSDSVALADAITDEEATEQIIKRIEQRNEKLEKVTKRSGIQERRFVLEYMVEAYEDFYGELHVTTPVHEFGQWWANEVFELDGRGDDAIGEASWSGKSSKDPVRQILLRSYARRSSNLEISRWADMLHDIGPGFRALMKENMRPGANICSFSWSLQY